MRNFRLIRLLFVAAAAVAALAAAEPLRRAVAVVSIDGMNPDYVLNADRYGLRIPTLRHFLRDGVHASSVRGVLPTVTYPSHTTMLTGVWPARHGIYANHTWDPLRKNQDGWYWYSEDIRVQTLWQAAARGGYITGNISWPVSAGAVGVSYNIPEYWRAQTPEDLKLLRLISTPGLLGEFQKTVGEYTVDLDAAEAGDWDRTRYAIALINRKGVRFLTLHLAALDHVAHRTGAFSPEALRALEEIDGMVAQVETAIRNADPRAAVCIVSDHGLSRVDHELNLNVAFVNAGLITVKSNGARNAFDIVDWKAQPWVEGGSAAIILKDPADGDVRARVQALLRQLASDPANGIGQILDHRQITALGGAPDAALWVDMKPNYVIGSALTGPLMRAVSVRGAHGFAPAHAEMLASFLLLAPDARRGYDLGQIDMRSIAPTLADVMHTPFPSAELKGLTVLEPKP